MKKDKTETNAPVKEEKSGGSKVKKVLKIVLNTIINILIVAVLLISLLVAIMALSSKETGVSKLFGYTIQTIQSNSMKGGSPDGYEGGDFEEGDLVIGKSTDFAADAEYEVGDIITYRGYDSNQEMFLMAHRIVDKKMGPVGYYVYQTWGDNREMSKVPDQLSEDQYLSAGDIASVIYDKDYHATVIKGVGGFIDKLKTDKAFFFLIILLPMIIFFMYALIRVILSASSYKKSQLKEMKEEAEKNKQEAIDEAVAAALAERDGAGEVKTETPAEMTPEQMEEFKKFLAFKEAQKASSVATPAEETPAEEAPAEE